MNDCIVKSFNRPFRVLELMQRQVAKRILLVAMVLSIATIGSGFAFADSQTDAANQGLTAGIALKVSGMSVLPGILLSLFSVWNKNITGTGSSTNGQEVVDIRKLMINIILGIVISVALTTIGIDTNTIKANSAFIVAVAVTAVNYMFLHLTNLGIRPLFAHLVTFKAAFDKWLAEQNTKKN